LRGGAPGTMLPEASAMAEHSCTVATELSEPEVWHFVREMDNWARFLTGYQSHSKRGETESVWTLKGDVGVLSRTLTFRVRVTEWAGPGRVAFELEGLNEPMRGAGSFSVRAAPPAGAESAAAAPRGRIARLWERLVRWLLRRGRGARAERPAPQLARSEMTFWLRVDPGGPMAPMIDAMMRPAMAAAAEDLAERIVAHLEEQRTGARP
jgi:carbon monoxide dehydrogenase subunit G